LFVVQVHTFSLNGAAVQRGTKLTKVLEYLLKLVLASLVFIVVSRRVPRFDTLGILRGFWQSQQLLLEFGGDIHRCKVSARLAHSNLGVGRVRAHEDAWLVALGTACSLNRLMRSRGCPVDPVRIVNSKGSILITSGLIELDGLPSVLSRLRDGRTARLLNHVDISCSNLRILIS